MKMRDAGAQEMAKQVGVATDMRIRQETAWDAKMSGHRDNCGKQ
jgi:hypothetical protein